jgi:hypothetical protein
LRTDALAEVVAGEQPVAREAVEALLDAAPELGGLDGARGAADESQPLERAPGSRAGPVELRLLAPPLARRHGRLPLQLGGRRPERGRRRRTQPRELLPYPRRRRRAPAQAPCRAALGRRRAQRRRRDAGGGRCAVERGAGGRDAAHDHGLLVELERDLDQVLLVGEECRQHAAAPAGEELLPIGGGVGLVVGGVGVGGGGGLVVGQVVRDAAVAAAARVAPARRRPHGHCRAATVVVAAAAPPRLF